MTDQPQPALAELIDPEALRRRALLQELAAYHTPRLNYRLQRTFLRHRQRMIALRSRP